MLHGVFHSPFDKALVDVNNDDTRMSMPQDSPHAGQGQADGMTRFPQPS